MALIVNCPICSGRGYIDGDSETGETFRCLICKGKKTVSYSRALRIVRALRGRR